VHVEALGEGQIAVPAHAETTVSGTPLLAIQERHAWRAS
jgi:hypothetical protein